MTALSVNCRNIQGRVIVPCSKSVAHRFLVCLFINGRYEEIRNIEKKIGTLSDDVEATRDCLLAIAGGESDLKLNCRESGTTLRFLMPLAAALGINCKLIAEGSLAVRPMQQFIDELNRHGATISTLVKNGRRSYQISGKLEAGEYTLPGNISSQFISGMMLASELMDGEITINVNRKLQSATYVKMTEQVIAAFKNGTEDRIIEGDWSSGSMWAVASFYREGRIDIAGLRENSIQADRKIAEILQISNDLDAEISVEDCPDLAPAIALWAACRNAETTITDAGRLRIKECDRLTAITEMLNQLGASAESTEDSITIKGSGNRRLAGSDEVVNTYGDHRMVMLAALLSIMTDKPVLIDNPYPVKKSYPEFFEDVRRLGGELVWN